MTSYYLTPEAEAQRMEALALRLRKDIIVLGGFQTFIPESDFWKLPQATQDKVGQIISSFGT